MELINQYKKGFIEANNKLVDLLCEAQIEGLTDRIIKDLYIANNDQRSYHNKLLAELGENVS